MTDTEKQLNEAREHLKALLSDLSGPPLPMGGMSPSLQQARDFLKRTEPKHPVEVEWEKWNKEHICDGPPERRAFHAGFRSGLVNAAETCGGPNDLGHHIKCRCSTCLFRHRIREAADKLPKE